MKTCSIIDAPSDLGLRRTGVGGLPQALRSAGLLEGLPAVRHAGSVPVPRYSPLRNPLHGVLNVDGIADFSRRLAERVAFTLDLGLFPLVRDEDAVAFGIRDAALAAADGSPDVRQTAMRVFDLGGVRKLGAAQAARSGIEALEASGAEGFWIHLDADVLNDDVMPAVDYRMPDGLWPQELSDALAVALASPLAVGMDVTIYNPAFDNAEWSAARILAQALTTAFVAAT